MEGSKYILKKELLLKMKEETVAQLQAIQQENVEKFLLHVENCEQIIAHINEINEQNLGTAPFEEQEIQRIIKEIMDIRLQINPLLLPLREKLQQKSFVEKRKAILQQGYHDDDIHPPSIFFDKKN
jgi:hypothetical protein